MGDHRHETRAERYAEKGRTAMRRPLHLVTVEFMCDGNLGYVLRAAACFGASSVHVIGAVPASSDLRRLSGGTDKLVPVVSHQDPQGFLAWLRESDPMAVLVSAELRDDAVSVHDYRFDPVSPTYVVVGNEEAGVPEGIVLNSDAVVYVPMPGPGFCLNTAQTANVIAFEYNRQLAEYSAKYQLHAHVAQMAEHRTCNADVPRSIRGVGSRGSSNGRTADFGSAYRGSSPCPRTTRA